MQDYATHLGCSKIGKIFAYMFDADGGSSLHWGGQAPTSCVGQVCRKGRGALCEDLGGW